jgi:hypothetical protein
MKRLLLLLLPAVAFAGQPRYARLGEFDGSVEVQLHPADPWSPAERNLTLRESAWLRTGPASRFEIELDEGSAWRLGADSQVEISDYSVLSSGQRLTVLSLDHGVAWFTGEPLGKDTLMLVVPGAQITFIRGARVRIEAGQLESRVSVIEGVVRLSCPAAEIDLREGQTVRVEPRNTARFGLDRDIVPHELDRWSEDRDKILAAPASMHHVAQRFGLADLDAAGQWLETDIGAVWKPRVADGWAPFQNGHWHWYDGLGYTWVSADSWGWVPYHFGRWTRKNDLGWVWVASTKTTFKPGDVYWLLGSRLAGWGPLAPGEEWSGNTTPQQFLNTNTTWASFPPDAPVIDPSGFTGRPAEPLKVSIFRIAAPSPTFIASRLEAVRPQLRVGATRFTPVLPGTTFQDASDVPPPPEPPQPPPANSVPPPDAGAYPPPDPGPPGPPMSTTYPVPAYTGIIVINPPDHPDYSRHNPNNPQNPKPAGQTTPPPDAQSHPRTVNQPQQTRPISPRMQPVETPRIEPSRPPDSKPAPAPKGDPPAARVDPPRVDTPRPTPPARIDAPGVDTPRPTPPSQAPARVDPPRMEAPRPAPSAPAAPRVEAPRVEAPRPAPSAPAPAPRAESPKVDAPKVDAPKVDAPKIDTPKKQ